MPAIKVYVNQEEDEILNKHGNQLIKQKLIQPPFNSYKMGKYIVNQFLKALTEKKTIKPTENKPKEKENINNTNFNNLISSSKITDKIKSIIKETEERSNTISQDELVHMHQRDKLHKIYAKITGY